MPMLESQGVSYFSDEMPVHVWVQLLEQIACVFRPIPAQMFLFQEEADAQIGFANYRRVLYREVANAG